MNLSARVLLPLLAAPLLVAQTKYSTDLMALNPLGYWPLNGNATDSTTHANNGALMNGVSFLGAVTPLGSAAAPAAVFASAQNNFIQMPTSGSSIFNFSSTHPFTAMAWIRTLGVSHMAIISKFDLVSGNGWSFSVGHGAGTLGLLLVTGGTPAGGASIAGVNDGNWHFVAATYDGSGSASGVQMYLDGVSTPMGAPVGSVGSISNSGPLTIGGEPDGSDAFDGNVNYPAVFGTVLTAAQIQQLYEDAVISQSILPQFAFGSGWYSAVYFTNTGTSPVSFPVSFTSDLGTPLMVPSINASSKTITLAAQSTTVIEAPNVGDLAQGYVSAALPTGVSGYGLFRQSTTGNPDQEGVASLSSTTSTLNTLLFDDTTYVTAVAIVNPSTIPITVSIRVLDNNGKLLGTSSVALPPLNKTEAVLQTLPGLSGMAGNRGTALFGVPAGNVAVLGIRFNGVAFTQIPAIVK